MTSQKSFSFFYKDTCRLVVTGGIFLFGTGLFGCSSARETSETSESPVEVVTSPGTIQTDEQRQQIYTNGAGSDAQQLPKPNLNDKASETNRKKEIEGAGTDNPALTPNELRPQQIKRQADPVVPGR